MWLSRVYPGGGGRGWAEALITLCVLLVALGAVGAYNARLFALGTLKTDS